MTISVLSPEKSLLETEAVEIILPTSVGPLGVLSGHEPMVAQLVPGTITIKHDKGEETVATLGGFVEVTPTAVYVMTDSSELAADLDELKAQEATERAKALASERSSQGEIQTATALLAQNLMHIKGVRRRQYRNR